MTSPTLEQVLARALLAQEPLAPVNVAFSGGPDSQALLLALSRLRGETTVVLADGVERFAGIVKLRALHVHHGLDPQADCWDAHCRRFCLEHAIPYTAYRVQVAQRPQRSLEEQARDARYDALASALGEGDLLLTAHTGDDQAETLLLNLFRGAGPAGLAAMPEKRPLGRGVLWRPLLGCSRQTLRDYLQEHGQGFVADPANIDPGFDRSYLRNQVLPGLQSRWPGLTGVLVRSAQVQAESAALLRELGHSDLQSIRGLAGQALLAAPLLALSQRSPARARNALQAWLREHGIKIPSRKRLRSILEQLLPARPDSMPCVRLGDVELRRYRGELHLVQPAAMPQSWSAKWVIPGRLDIPGGYLSATWVRGSGIPVAALAGRSLQIRPRRGGERCRLAGRSGTRAVKHLLQERGVPPWIRKRLPMIYDGDELVAVADFWVCEAYVAQGSEPGWQVQWTLTPTAVGSSDLHPQSPD